MLGGFYLTYNHGDGYFIFHGETEFVFLSATYTRPLIQYLKSLIMCDVLMEFSCIDSSLDEVPFH